MRGVNSCVLWDSICSNCTDSVSFPTKSQGRPSADPCLDVVDLPHCVLLLEDESFSGTACVYGCVYICTYVCAYVFLGTGIYVLQVQLHMCLCMYNVCMHVVCMHVALYIRTYVSV